MSNLFEYSDVLNSPIEAFFCKEPECHLPIHAHWHYFVEILYVYQGEITVTCNEHSYLLTPGALILLPPQVIHKVYSLNDQKDVNYACVKFNINKIQLVGNYLPNLNVLLRQIAQLQNPPLVFDEGTLDHISLSDYFERIIQEVDNRCYGYNSYVYTMLSELMVKILRHWYYTGQLMQTDNIEEQSEYSLQNILVYIDEHSSENINIEKLAHMCNMSYSYFAKLFHKQFGQSCKQYIEFVRLSKAENLLLFTGLDLTEIAGETGFSDCSHLIRCFRKKYNITPKQFRMHHAKTDSYRG